MHPPHAPYPWASQRWLWLTGTLLLVYLAVGIALVDDYAITFDETFHARHADNVIAWYASGFQDRAFESHLNLRYYGSVFGVGARIVSGLLNTDIYQTRHVLGLFFAVATVAGVASIVGILVGSAGAFFAAVILTTTPRFFAHGFNNPIDIPFGALYVWSFFALLLVLRGLPRPRVWHVALLGMLCGLTIGIRIAGVVLFGYLALAFGLWWLSRVTGPTTDEPLARQGRVLARLAGIALAVGAIAAVVTFPFWPHWHVDPIGHPIETLLRVSGFQQPFNVVFGGEAIPNNELPRTYIWTWLALILPETYAVALVAGLVLAWVGLRSGRPWREHEPRILGWIMVSAAALGPLVLATILRTVIYDDVRHFFFATALLAAPAGAAMGALVTKRVLAPKVVSVVLAGAFAVALGRTVQVMARLHPYEAVYFNDLVAGGLASAASRYDTDYWGQSLKEGAEWLSENVGTAGARPRVATNGHPTQVDYFLPDDRFEFVPWLVRDDPYTNPPDYALLTTRWNRHLLYPGEEMYRVERDGVLLMRVVRVDRVAARGLGRGSSETNPR